MNIRTVSTVLSLWVGGILCQIASSDAAVTVPQDLNHCGAAAAETILHLYGETDKLLSQRHLAICHNARVAEYADRRGDSTAPELYYPQFEGMYQPIFAEMLIDRGFAVISTRGAVTRGGERIVPRVLEVLIEHLAKGHWAIIALGDHYLAITGYDAEKDVLYFNDTVRPESRFSVELELFVDPKRSWHENPEGKPRAPWGGHAIIFWKPATAEERALNGRHRCPACGERYPGTAFTYCPRCGAYIDRRRDGYVQRGLDAIALSTMNFQQTRVRVRELPRMRQRLSMDDPIPELRWMDALVNYPLTPRTPGSDRIETLKRDALNLGVDVRSLSTSTLEAIVSGRGRWPKLLQAEK